MRLDEFIDVDEDRFIMAISTRQEALEAAGLPE